PYASLIPDREEGAAASRADGAIVNDIHSQLNRTRVAAIVKPRTVEELQDAIHGAAAEGRAVSIAGGRHAMGGQQFGEDNLLVDTRALNRIVDFNADEGTMAVEGGIQWPQLLDFLNREQNDRERQWGIYQKQTGADRLSVGGALSCNAHGRGLN